MSQIVPRPLHKCIHLLIKVASETNSIRDFKAMLVGLSLEEHIMGPLGAITVESNHGANTFTEATSD